MSNKEKVIESIHSWWGHAVRYKNSTDRNVIRARIFDAPVVYNPKSDTHAEAVMNFLQKYSSKG